MITLNLSERLVERIYPPCEVDGNCQVHGAHVPHWFDPNAMVPMACILCYPNVKPKEAECVTSTPEN